MAFDINTAKPVHAQQEQIKPKFDLNTARPVVDGKRQMDFENPEDLAEIIKDPRSFNSFGFGDFNLGLAKGVIEGGAGIPQMIAQFGEKLGISGQREFLDKLESEVKVAKDAIDSATSDSPIVAGTGDVVGQSIPALASP